MAIVLIDEKEYQNYGLVGDAVTIKSSLKYAESLILAYIGLESFEIKQYSKDFDFNPSGVYVLPHPRIVSVDKINDKSLAASDYSVRFGRQLNLYNGYNTRFEEDVFYAKYIKITYTAGWDSLPDNILLALSQITKAYMLPSNVQGAKRLRQGDLEIEYTDSGIASGITFVPGSSLTTLLKPYKMINVYS